MVNHVLYKTIVTELFPIINNLIAPRVKIFSTTVSLLFYLFLLFVCRFNLRFFLSLFFLLCFYYF